MAKSVHYWQFSFGNYAGLYLVLGILISGLDISLSGARAQEIGELPSDRGISGKQAPIFWHDEDARFDLDASTNQWSVIIKERAKPSARVPLPGYINQFYSIRRASSTRVVVLAQGVSGAYYVGIVGVDTGVMIDEFLSSAEPKLSPNNRYIIFVRIYPMHGAEGYDDQYRLYDIMGDRSGNWPHRTAQPAPAGQPSNYDDSLAGVAVYPLDANEKERQNTFVEENESHKLVAPFVWDSKSERVVFGDYASGMLSFVVVTVPTSNGEPSETFAYKVPAGQNPCFEFCLPKNIEYLRWLGSSVNVQLMSKKENVAARVSKLELPLSQFTPVH